MEPAEILPIDENTAVVPAAKKVFEPLGDITVTIRSPLLDVSNRSFADVTLNGSSNEGDKTIAEVDDSSTCGGKSETESPASSTPSRLDTTTDDYESADEGPSSPIHAGNLSVLTSQLESLSLGTPNPAPGRPGALFPYSPVTENSILLSSPERDDDGHLDRTIGVSPITLVGSPPVSVLSPDSDENVSSGNDLLEPFFKVPEAVVKHERPSIASSSTGRSNDTFYTADSTFWSPCHDHNAINIKFLEDTLNQNTVESPDTVEENHSSNATDCAEREIQPQPAAPEIKFQSKKPFEDTLLNTSPKTDESVDVKSPVNDFIANSDKITLRKDSPLATSIQEKCYGEDLNLSLRPAQIDIDQVISKRHSTGFCKKDILLPKHEVVKRHSFQEILPDEFGTVIESPDRRRSSTNYFFNIETSVSSKSLNKTSDHSAELEIAEQVVDSCIAAASNIINQDLLALSSTANYVEVLHAEEIKRENLATLGLVVDEVCEGSFIVENAIGERLSEETGVTHSSAESPIQVDNSHEKHLPGKDLSVENKNPACGSEILTEANPKLGSTADLSTSGVSDGVSIDGSKYEVSLNSDESVSINESTVIENDNIVISTEPNQELFARTAHCAKEDAKGCIPNGTDIPSENTEATVLSEQQSSSAASIQVKSENLISPLPAEECGLHIGDQLVLGLTNNTSGEESCIQATELPNQTSKTEPDDEDELNLISAKPDLNVNVTSKEPSHKLMVGHTADCAKDGASESIPNGTEMSSEETEVTNLSKVQSSTTEFIQAEQPSESFQFPVDSEVYTNTTSVDETIIEVAELPNPTSERAESAVPLPLKTVTIEDKLATSLEETHIIQKPEDSTESTSQLPGIPSKPDSNVNVVTSSEPSRELVVAQTADSTKEDATIGDKLATSLEETHIIQKPEDSTEPTSQLPGIPSKPDSNVNVVTSSEPSLKLMVGHTADCAKDGASESIPNGTEMSSEKTEVTNLSKVQSSTTEFIQAEQPSESLQFPVDSEVYTSTTSVDETIIEVAELPNPTSERAESAVPLPLKTVTIEDKLATSLEETHIIQKPEDSTESTSQLPGIPSKPDSNVNVVTSSEPSHKLVVAQTADSTKEDATIEDKLATSLEETHVIQKPEDSTESTSQLPGIPSKPDSNVNVVTSSEPSHELVVAQTADSTKKDARNRTNIPSEKTEVTYLSELQSSTTAFIQAEHSSEYLPSPVGSEVRTKEISGEEKIINAAELLIQTSEIGESAVFLPSKGVAIENKLASSPEEVHIVHTSEDIAEPTSQLPGIPSKSDSKVNGASSVEVDFGSGMSPSGESFIVMNNGQGLQRAGTIPNENSELIKKFDFSSLYGTVQQKSRIEQDIKSESMDFYSSPESTADQNISDGKSDAMDRSHKDLSNILATCSKQEQELGGRTFDFSCIQAEAAKIASDITHANETKSSEQTNTQPMMQSASFAEPNNSEAGPVTADEDFNKEEFFHEATALDFEYLARAGSKQHCPSKLSRQSLYVKFDPLVGKLISSEDSNSSLLTAMADHNQSSGEEGKLDITPPSHSESDERLIPITPSTAKKENRQVAGGHTPSLRQEISKLQELMIQQEQAHQEKADLVEELRSRIAELEASDNHRDSSDLEKKLQLRDEEFKLVQEELDRAKSSNKQLVQVMEEYEKTISQLVTVKEETKAQMEKDKETIGAERDTALQHLSNMEVAFNDIHQKYERAKTVIETLHANEKELKKSYDAVVETVEAQNVAYQKLKQHAAEKLTAANAEIEKIHKEYNGEMARMKAVAKKNELKCKSLEESLEQKKKELRELTQICDELIANHTPS